MSAKSHGAPSTREPATNEDPRFLSIFFISPSSVLHEIASSAKSHHGAPREPAQESPHNKRRPEVPIKLLFIESPSLYRCMERPISRDYRFDRTFSFCSTPSANARPSSRHFSRRHGFFLCFYCSCWSPGPCWETTCGVPQYYRQESRIRFRG